MAKSSVLFIFFGLLCSVFLLSWVYFCDEDALYLRSASGDPGVVNIPVGGDKVFPASTRRVSRAVNMPVESHENDKTFAEKNNSSLRHKRNGIIRLNIPANRLRTSEMGIPVGEALAPPLCPPPSITQSLHICYLKKCSSHRDCPGDNVCCFNGCIRTCTESMDQPAAFDWVEDTSKILPILGMEFEESRQPFFPVLLQSQSPEFAAAEGGEELVHMPGGCYVSATQYHKLKEFMEAPSIEECRCNDGEVVCDVRSEKS